jgi:hypothetical protein
VTHLLLCRHRFDREILNKHSIRWSVKLALHTAIGREKIEHFLVVNLKHAHRNADGECVGLRVGDPDELSDGTAVHTLSQSRVSEFDVGEWSEQSGVE